MPTDQPNNAADPDALPPAGGDARDDRTAADVLADTGTDTPGGGGLVGGSGAPMPGGLPGTGGGASPNSPLPDAARPAPGEDPHGAGAAGAEARTRMARD